MRRDEIWTIIGGATLATILLWIGIAALIRYEQAESDARIARDGRNLATAVAGQSDRTLLSTDRMLRLIASLAQRDGEGFDLRALDASAQLTSPLIFLVAVTDAAGHVTRTTLPGPVPAVDLSDREHFRIHAEHRTDGLYVSAPVRGSVTGQWKLVLSRAVTRPDGSFAGIVFASVDPAYLGTLYRNLDLGQTGTIMLLGEDGGIRARTDTMDESSVLTLRGTALFDYAISGSTRPTGFDSPTDPVHRLYVARHLADFPLIALIGFDESDITVPLARQRLTHLTAGGIATALIAVFVLIIRHRLRRQSIAETLLREAIEGMPDGFILFDARDRLVTWNKRYEAIFPYLKPILRPGMEFADLARHAAYFVTGSEDSAVCEAWAQWRIERHRSDEPVFNQTLTDARVLETAERTTAAGGIVSVTRDISAVKRGEQTLAAAEARFRDFALIAADWFWETDAQHRFTFVSERAERIRIYPSALRRLDRTAEGNAAIQEALAAQTGFRNQPVTLHRDGETMQIVLSAMPVRAADGRFLGYRGSARNLTGRLAAELAIRADIAAEERRAFAALLAELAERIRSATGLAPEEHMAALLDLADNAKELAALEHGDVGIERGWFEIGTVIDGVMAGLSAAAGPKEIRFERRYATGAVPVLWGHAGRIRRILEILAGNAVRHAESGAVTFVIGLERSGETGCTLCIEIHDEGSGIRSDAQAELFRSPSGLGLKIFRHLVQLMAGEFGMTSEFGIGSTFWFRVPLETELSADPEDAAMPDRPDGT